MTRQDSEQGFAAVQEHIPTGLLGSSRTCPCAANRRPRKAPAARKWRSERSPSPSGRVPTRSTVPPGCIYLTGPTLLERYQSIRRAVRPVGCRARARRPVQPRHAIVRAALEIDPRTAAVTPSPARFPRCCRACRRYPRASRPKSTAPTSSSTRQPRPQSDLGDDGRLCGRSRAPPRRTSQATDCATLRFEPKLSVSTSGHTSKANGASLDAKLAYPATTPGTARRTSPRSKSNCPSSSPHGSRRCRKRARSGRSKPTQPPARRRGRRRGDRHHPAAVRGAERTGLFVLLRQRQVPRTDRRLQGDGVTLYLHGETFISKTGIVSSTFPAVPDAPVGSFEPRSPRAPTRRSRRR